MCRTTQDLSCDYAQAEVARVQEYGGTSEVLKCLLRFRIGVLARRKVVGHGTSDHQAAAPLVQTCGGEQRVRFALEQFRLLESGLNRENRGQVRDRDSSRLASRIRTVQGLGLMRDPIGRPEIARPEGTVSLQIQAVQCSLGAGYGGSVRD